MNQRFRAVQGCGVIPQLHQQLENGRKPQALLSVFDADPTPNGMNQSSLSGKNSGVSITVFTMLRGIEFFQRRSRSHKR